jgi:hypothetical protein
LYSLNFQLSTFNYQLNKLFTTPKKCHWWLVFLAALLYYQLVVIDVSPPPEIVHRIKNRQKQIPQYQTGGFADHLKNGQKKEIHNVMLMQYRI